MKHVRHILITASMLLLSACQDPGARNSGVYMLMDTSGNAPVPGNRCVTR